MKTSFSLLIDENPLYEHRKIYTVSALTRLLKLTLEEEFPFVEVKGELSNLRKPLSGHIYFTLKDEKAQIGVVVFRNTSVSVKLEEGVEYIVTGRISLYEARGEYRIIASNIERTTLGNLWEKFLQLKEKLQKEGLFEKEHKKPIPENPSIIGIITSLTGAAIQDMLRVIREKKFNGTIRIYPVHVQGKEAAFQIAEAITLINKYLPDTEVLIIGRGGGSIEDLWAFNEEIVARAIFASKIPIISAVGHEIDITISDMVADLRALTPTDAANKVIPDLSYIYEHLERSIKSLNYLIEDIVQEYSYRIDILEQELENLSPINLINTLEIQIKELEKRLEKSFWNLLNHFEFSIRNYERTLKNLNPLNILERGYSILYNEEGEIISSVKRLKRNDEVICRVKDGKIRCNIKEIVQNDRGEKK